MARQWKMLAPEEAKQHPLYGVKNWLAVFACGMLLSPVREFGAVVTQAEKAGMSVGDLFALDLPVVHFLKMSLLIECALVAVIFWLLFSKDRSFRVLSSWILAMTWPVLVVQALASPFPGSVETLAMSFFPWLLSCAIWITYLQRSRRVRVTFEHCVLVDDVRSRSAGGWSLIVPLASSHMQIKSP